MHYLKHLHDLPDEPVVKSWTENPYWQYFCGKEYFQHRQATLDQNEAVTVMKEKYEAERRLLPCFDYHVLFSAPTAERMSGIAQAMEFILTQENGKKRYLPFVLTMPHGEALAIPDEVSLFQKIRANLLKVTVNNTKKEPDTKNESQRTVFLFNGGEGGIRTLGTQLTYTHFPGVLLQPLGHLTI